MNPIGAMNQLSGAELALLGGQPAQAAARTGDSPFLELLESSLRDSAELQNAAQSAAESWLAGDEVTQVEVLTAMKKADIALKMLLQIRNRALQAYNEIKDLRM